MPDTKITALTAIGANPIIPATFPIPMVDLTDTSMAASGTTKKVTVNQILGAGGTATLASATITGDLTVRTNKLKVDATGVAIGATSASYPLDVTGDTRFIGDAYLFSTTGGTAFSKSLIFGSAANPSAASIYSQTASANSGILYLATETGGVMTDRLGIGADGIFTWQNVGGVAGTAMTLNSTGLGVGVTPSAGRGAIQLSAGVSFPATQVASSDANTLDDYEEGSWVPTLNSGTFSSASCRYTKIGNMVTIFFDVTVGTGGGNQITNLPFTAAATSTVANGIYTNNQDYAAGTTAPVVVVGGSSSTLFFRTVGDNVAFSAMTLTAAANLTGSISYFV